MGYVEVTESLIGMREGGKEAGMLDDKNVLHSSMMPSRIAINDPGDVRNWCRSFGCKEQDLKKAVRVVGTLSVNVRKYLAK